MTTMTMSDVFEHAQPDSFERYSRERTSARRLQIWDDMLAGSDIPMTGYVAFADGQIALMTRRYQSARNLKTKTAHLKIYSYTLPSGYWTPKTEVLLQPAQEAGQKSQALQDLRTHKWIGQCRGGDPTDAGSCEWVRYCSVCGMEDTCEDPLPPCPGETDAELVEARIAETEVML